jgi:hypothetical protein
MSFLGFGVAVQAGDAQDARELELALDQIARDVEHRRRAVAVRAVEGAMDDRPHGRLGEKHQANSCVIDGGGLPGERGERSIAGLSACGHMRPPVAAGEGGREEFRLID